MEEATWVLAFATIGLLFATCGLFWSTRQYTKATKRMHELNALQFLHQFEDTIHAGSGQNIATLLHDMMGGEDAEHKREKTLSGYNGLFKKVLDDMYKDFSKYDPIRFRFGRQ